MAPRFLTSNVDRAYALLRIVAGLLFLFHGLQKLFGVLSDKPKPPFGDQLWFGGVIELVTGLLLVVGLWTRGAAFLASGTMAVAYIQFHWELQMDERFFPIVNKGELALLYAFVFLYIACRGAGIWSIDRSRGGSSRT